MAAPTMTARDPRADELFQAAEALVPDLRAHNEQTEADRWIGDDLSQRLNDGGFYRMLAPARFGGAELTVRETLDILTKIAEGCPSAAWVAGIHNASIWLAALYPLAAQEEVFGGPAPTVISGTLAPLGRLEPVPGGYRLTGRWGFASGVLDATWMLLGAPRPSTSGDDDPGVVFALAPMTDIRIHKDWDTMGLAGTGSHSVEAQDIFVPEHRIIDPVAASAGEYPSEYASEVSLYRSAFLPVLSAVLVCPALGATKRMLEEYLRQVPKKRVAYTIYEKAAESVVTQIRVAEAACLIDEAQFHQDRLADSIDSWAAGGEYMPEDLRVRARMDIGRALDLCRTAANLIFSLGGGSGIARSNPVQRLFRDVQAGNSHPLQMATVQYEVYGRQMLGQPQITAFI